MRDLTPNIPEVVSEVSALFERYEQALIDKNVDVLDATLCQTNHIHIAFDDDNRIFVVNRLAGLRQAIQFAALLKKGRFGRVEVFRLAGIEDASAKADDIAALVAQKGFASLKAPIRLVTAPHTPVPFAPNLEAAYIPSAARVLAAVREICA